MTFLTADFAIKLYTPIDRGDLPFTRWQPAVNAKSGRVATRRNRPVKKEEAKKKFLDAIALKNTRVCPRLRSPAGSGYRAQHSSPGFSANTIKTIGAGPRESFASTARSCAIE